MERERPAAVRLKYFLQLRGRSTTLEPRTLEPCPSQYLAAIIVCFLQFAACAAAAAPHELPRSKTGIEPCRLAVLALHPGQIEKFRVAEDAGAFYFVYEVRSSDGSSQVIRCDASTGKVVSEERR